MAQTGVKTCLYGGETFSEGKKHYQNLTKQNCADTEEYRPNSNTEFFCLVAKN